MNFSTTMTVGWCNRPATTKKLLKFNQKENVPIQVDLAIKWDQMMKFAHVHKELIHPNVTNVCLVSGLTQVCIAAIICHNDELSLSLTWLEIVYNSIFWWIASRYKKVKRIRIKEILRRIWLLSANMISFFSMNW